MKGPIMAQITKNDIPTEVRNNINLVLGQLLADAIDLHYQTKQAHWNVKGENFIALHQLFDALAAEVSLAVDTIAERIIQLGGSAQGTVRVAAQKSRLQEYPLDITDSQQHIDALSSALAAFNKSARKGIDETAELGDAVSADMLTGITSGLDKQLWFVESHLKNK